jgi:hypothetical protein
MVTALIVGLTAFMTIFGMRVLLRNDVFAALAASLDWWRFSRPCSSSRPSTT